MKGIRYNRFEQISAEVDLALTSLQTPAAWPLDLYRLLFELAPRDRRALFVCLDNDEPVGVLALAQDDRATWEPVTQWILPGWIGPMTPERTLQIASAVPVRTRFAWWRMPSAPPPPGGRVRSVGVQPTCAMAMSADFEAYWKHTGQLRSIRKARTRCSGLTFGINLPGAARWAITRADELWRTDSRRPTPQMAGRIAAAEYLEPRGQHFTLTLQDGDRWVAGDTYVVDGNDLVAQCTWRDRAYDHHGVGVRLLDLGLHWARQRKFGSVDLGGGYDYKRKWAPECGTKATVLVSPLLPYIGYRATRWAASWSSRARARLGRLAAASGPMSGGRYEP